MAGNLSAIFVSLREHLEDVGKYTHIRFSWTCLKKVADGKCHFSSLSEGVCHREIDQVPKAGRS